MNAWHNRRILLVDDNRTIHADFRKILTQGDAASALDQDESLLFGTAAAVTTLGFELDSAYQGQEALAKVHTALLAGLPYALTFVDMRMPPAGMASKPSSGYGRRTPACR
jgi:CheY-like chemotaxis protein